MKKVRLMSGNTLIIKTNYFNHYWTWIKRTILFTIIFFIILLWNSINPEYNRLGYLFASIAFIIIFAIPKDDLVVDREYFYHIKKSIFPFFTKAHRYELSKIKSIRAKGTYSGGNDLFDFVSLGNIYQSLNSIEILFKDDSSINISVAIYKKDLDEVLHNVRELLFL